MSWDFLEFQESFTGWIPKTFCQETIVGAIQKCRYPQGFQVFFPFKQI